MVKDPLVNLTKYNLWANTKIFGFIIEAGEEKADVIQNSSFPSIRETLYHIWDAETIWNHRLSGKSITYWPSKSFKGTLKEAGELFLKTSKDFADYTEGKSEEAFNILIKYQSTDGKEYSNSVLQIVMHCMNHSTFHRGQIVTMLRNTGVTIFSSTDYIAFSRL